MEKLTGYSCKKDFALWKDKKYYKATIDNQVIARFDSEKKGRIFCDGMLFVFEHYSKSLT